MDSAFLYLIGARPKNSQLRDVLLPRHALPGELLSVQEQNVRFLSENRIPSETPRSNAMESDQEAMEIHRFDPDAPEAQIQQMNFETAEPLTEFQTTQTCSFDLCIPYARTGRISESPTYDCLRIPSNGNVVGCPSVLARSGEIHLRCAIAGPDSTHSAISAAHQQQRARWIREGHEDYTVPYDLPHCFVSDVEHYNSSRPISTPNMPKGPLSGMKKELKASDEIKIKAGSLEQFRQLAQFTYNTVSQLIHFHNWSCKQMVLVKDGKLLLSKFMSQLSRRLRNQRQVLGAAAESTSALCDSICVQVRSMIAGETPYQPGILP